MGFEKIKEIELKYPLREITSEGQQVWPLIRTVLWTHYTSRLVPIKISSLKVSELIQLTKQFFFGFRFYFRKYDYLCFSDSSERKLIDGKWIDKSVDYILNELSSVLLFETPLPIHRKNSATRFLASKLPLYLLARLYSAFFLRNIRVQNEQVITEIFTELRMDFDYKSTLRSMLSQYQVGIFLNFLYKPKAVFIQCSYTNMGFVKAFRDNGVIVIEVQHGLISSSHEAYNVFTKFDPSYSPSYFLSYGTREIDLFGKSHFLESSERVIPVGHYYLDLVSSSTQTRSEVIPEVLDFDFGVAVTGQNLYDVESRLIKLITQAAIRMPDVCFFYIPRSSKSEIFTTQELPQNLVVSFERDTYEVIRLCDVHTTIFSTCAIEAIVLGVPNVLINIDDLTVSHLKEILGCLPATEIVDNVTDYESRIRAALNSKKPIKPNPYLIAPEYRKNIANFIDTRIR